MDLRDYLKESGRGAGAALARVVGVRPVMVCNWAAKAKPVPVSRAVMIERGSGSKVRRWDLRPLDWHIHWPELIGTENAPPVPSSIDPAPESLAAAPTAWPPLPPTTQEKRDAT